MDKKLAIKRKKKGSHQSKRTTPGEVMGRDAAPRIVHLEGKRWINTTESQIQAKKKITQRRILKKKGR